MYELTDLVRENIGDAEKSPGLPYEDPVEFGK